MTAAICTIPLQCVPRVSNTLASGADRDQAGRTLVTGVAGFIGSFVAEQLLERGDRSLALDDLNDYYDPELKRARLARLQRFRADSQFVFERD